MVPKKGLSQLLTHSSGRRQKSRRRLIKFVTTVTTLFSDLIIQYCLYLGLESTNQFWRISRPTGKEQHCSQVYKKNNTTPFHTLYKPLTRKKPLHTTPGARFTKNRRINLRGTLKCSEDKLWTELNKLQHTADNNRVTFFTFQRRTFLICGSTTLCYYF